MLAFVEAVSLVGGQDLYWAGRATLISRREDVPAYDRVYRLFFSPFGGVPAPPPARARPMVRVAANTGAGEPNQPAGDGTPDVALASRAEALRRKSFALCTRAELAELARLMARIRLVAPERRSRRLRSARAGRADLRRTLRRAFRTGGEPIERAWRERRRERRRLVFVVDASGSMSPYSRALLLFAHAAVRSERRWEAYAFGTRLTRLTPMLAVEDPDAALRLAALQAGDWDGGTRIGESIEALVHRQEHARLVRGAVVVICSHGLDVGDPELLAAAMVGLRRLAHRVVWVNPLKEYRDYEPLARGMSAALPHVDVFESAHNLDALERLARALARLR
jgi:uncharacterized protein with von Willebrand factor type A (vWA) domain